MLVHGVVSRHTSYVVTPIAMQRGTMPQRTRTWKVMAKVLDNECALWRNVVVHLLQSCKCGAFNLWLKPFQCCLLPLPKTIIISKTYYLIRLRHMCRRARKANIAHSHMVGNPCRLLLQRKYPSLFHCFFHIPCQSWQLNTMCERYYTISHFKPSYKWLLHTIERMTM